MVVNIQGSSLDLYDPEIANSDQAANVNEMLFCAGNLNAVAMSNFKSQHKCNMFITPKRTVSVCVIQCIAYENQNNLALSF